MIAELFTFKNMALGIALIWAFTFLRELFEINKSLKVIVALLRKR